MSEGIEWQDDGGVASATVCGVECSVWETTDGEGWHIEVNPGVGGGPAMLSASTCETQRQAQGMAELLATGLGAARWGGGGQRLPDEGDVMVDAKVLADMVGLQVTARADR